jgi:hypothetical protein
MNAQTIKQGGSMVFFIIQLTSIAFMGLDLLIVLTLLLQESSKSHIAGSNFPSLHQTLVHRYGRAMGITETGAFVTILIMTILLEGQWTLFILSAVTWICVAWMIAIWTIRIYPINKRVELWDTNFIPEDLPKVRKCWHRFHVERAILAFIGFVTLIITASVS